MAIDSLYYVYTLRRKDNGNVFYIGKGRGKRIKETIRRVSENPHKYNTIQKYGCFSVIEEYFNSEKEALRIEAEMIERIGLDKLTNMVEGGSQPPNVGYLKWKAISVGNRHFKNIPEAAEYYGVHKTQVHRWLKQGYWKDQHAPFLIGNKIYTKLEYAVKGENKSKRTIHRWVREGKAMRLYKEVTYRN